MLPFFLYFGGKFKLAEKLGPPKHDHVIEPFAGSAGYSIFWKPPRVTLVDCDPVIASLWKYLTKVSATEIMRLPSNISHVDELSPRVCQEAKWLIGFWFNHGLESPAVHRSPWARTPIMARRFWSETIKLRIASQLSGVRHWEIVQGSYEQAPDVRAHYFIDPPYSNNAGKTYRHHDLDYEELAKWCKRRRGFVQVTAQDGAEWLPFRPYTLLDTHRARGFTPEAVYEVEN